MEPISGPQPGALGGPVPREPDQHDPVVLVLLSAGWGLLLERATGTPLPGVLVIPAGFAAIVVVGQLLTLFDATAELATPVVVAVAVLGGGPALAGLFGRMVRLANGATVTADEAYLRESILNPQAKLVAGYPAIMPTYQGLVSEEELMQLIAHLKALAPPAAVTR